MSKHRTVNTHFWDDSYIETLNPFEMLLFLFLITNPQTNIAGVYEITVKRMHERTRIPKARILQILEKFEKDGKFIYKNNVMLAVNAIAHQKTDVPSIKTGIETIVTKAPQWVRNRVGIDYEFLSHLILIPSNSITSNAASPPKASESEEKTIFLVAILSGVKKELGLTKLSHGQERDWSNYAALAFDNGFTAADFLECFALLRKQKWRTNAVSAEQVNKNLSELSKLRSDAKQSNGQKLPSAAEKLAADEEYNRNRQKAVPGVH